VMSALGIPTLLATVTKLDPPIRRVRSHPSSRRVFRAGVPFADLRFVQDVAWRVVPSWSLNRPARSAMTLMCQSVSPGGTQLALS
jgi:hypothetical protein